MFFTPVISKIVKYIKNLVKASKNLPESRPLVISRSTVLCFCFLESKLESDIGVVIKPLVHPY